MALLTYSAVGNREDLSDIISNISPTKTPCFTMFGKAKATATYHEWLEDDYDDAASNAQLEGADYSIADPDPRTRKGNYLQIMSRGYGVSGSQEAVLKAGIKSEIAYQMVKAMKELAKDVEYAIVNNSSRVAGSSAVARQFGGLPYWITTNVNSNGGTPRDITKALLDDAIQDAWDHGGDVDVVLCSGAQKRAISALNFGITRNIDAASKKAIVPVDVYDTDFGIVRIIPSRFLDNSKIYCLQKSLWKIAWLRPFKKDQKAKTGDKIEKIIIGELTLEARAEYGNSAITDLQVS